FMGPLDAVKPWQRAQIQGVARFLDRFYAVATREHSNAIDADTRKTLHKTIEKVTSDVESMAFNTAISAMMILLNDLAEHDRPPPEAVRALTLLLAPFAPHVAEEVWKHLGHGPSLAYEPWPSYDERLTLDETREIPVQVNGRVRGHVTLPRGAPESIARD